MIYLGSIYIYKDVLVYLDNIICFSEDFDEHIKLLQSVFDILAKANLKLKPIKCKYALNKIKYLGNIISEEGLSPDPGKLQAIRDYPPPKSLKELRGFIGLCNYYRRHINNFSKYSKCLTDLTRKDVPFIWSEECERSFNTLKQKLMSAPTVALPRYDQDYTIFTDASGSSLAAVLTQVQDGQERLISCVGRNVLPAETRYSAHEKESLAIFYAFKMFDPYVRYSHTDVYTDCKSLCEILTKRPISPRIAKWGYFLTMYDFDIKYRAGVKNHVDGISGVTFPTDVPVEQTEPPHEPFINEIYYGNIYKDIYVNNDEFLQTINTYTSDSDSEDINNYSYSETMLQHIAQVDQFPRIRNLTTDPCDCAACNQGQINEIIIDSEHKESASARADTNALSSKDMTEGKTHQSIPYGSQLTLDLIATEQKLDLKLKPLIDFLITGELPNDEKLARKIILLSTNYNVTDDLLYHQQSTRAKNVHQLHIQLVIQNNLKSVILKEYHDNMGHRGIINTFHCIRQNYFWINMYNDCHHYVQTCTTCMQHKHVNKKDRAPLTPITPPNRPGAHWFTDIIGPVRTTKHGNSYILTCVDAFSKWVEIIPLRNITAHTVARAIFEHIICTFGCFETISSDQGRQYTSAVFNYLTRLTNSKHILAASGHHAAVGQVEKENQSIERILAKYINFEKDDWDEMLPMTKLAINISITESTGLSPYLINFGREPRIALDIALKKSDKIQRNMEDEIEELIEKVNYIDKIGKDNLEDSKIKMKRFYDKKSTAVNYKVGQLVWLYIAIMPMAAKFTTRWHGPYRVIGKKGEVNFKLRRVADGVILPLAVHLDRLQPFYERHILPPIPLIPIPPMSKENESLLNDCIMGNNSADEKRNDPNTDLQSEQQNTTLQETDQLQPQIDRPSEDTVINDGVLLQSARHSNLGTSSRAESCIPPQLPRPKMSDCEIEREVHNIPKARKINNTVEYYIIYQDQVNKNIGEYVTENKLTNTEKNYIQQHKDNIRIMHHTPKVKINQVYTDDNNSSVSNQSKMTNYFEIMI